MNSTHAFPAHLTTAHSLCLTALAWTSPISKYLLKVPTSIPLTSMYMALQSCKLLKVTLVLLRSQMFSIHVPCSIVTGVHGVRGYCPSTFAQKLLM